MRICFANKKTSLRRADLPVFAVDDSIETDDVPNQTSKSANNVLSATLDVLKYIESSKMTF